MLNYVGDLASGAYRRKSDDNAFVKHYSIVLRRQS